MAPLTIQECAGAYGTPRAVVYPDFGAFADSLKSPETVPDKKIARTFLPAELHEDGGPKELVNIARVTAMALDFDGITEEELLRVLQDDLAGLRWAAHTTFSHPEELRTTGKQRWRVWLELSQPVAASQWTRLRENFDALLSVVVDVKGKQNTKNPNRLMFAPCTLPGEEGLFESLDWREFPALSAAEPLDVTALDAMPAPSPAPAPDDWVDDASEPVDRDEVRSLANKYMRRSGAWDHKVGRWLKRILKGDAFVTEQSHEPTMDLARVMAEELNHVSAEALGEFIAPSLSTMQALYGSDETVRGFVEKVRSWRRKKHAERARVADIEIPGMRRAMVGDFLGADALAMDMLESGGEPRKSHSKDVEAPWIVQKEDTYFFRQKDGNYSRQYSAVEAETAVDELLAGTPVPTFDYTDKGERVDLRLREIARRSAVLAEDLIFKPGDENQWDPVTRSMIMACCRINPKLEPKNHPGVIEWIKGIFGADAEAALDWFAMYPQLEYTSRALLMVGPRKVGKSLIIKSLAQVFGRLQGLDLDMAQQWNQQLLKCPLVHSDERTKVGLADLRKLVAGVEPVINRKFKESTEASIRPRVVLGANDLEIFASDSGLTAESLAATKERFLAVRVVPRDDLLPAKPEDRESWWQKEIPETILYLAATRDVQFEPGARFAGRSGGFDVTIAVAVNTDSSAIVCGVAAQFLAERQRTAKFAPTDQAFVKEGVLHVTYEFLRSRWEARSGDKPRHREIRSAVHALSLDGESVVRGRDSRKRFWRLDPAKLARFVADTGDYGEEDVQEWLAQDDAAKVLQLGAK